jgi:hypothetical protein
LTRRGEDEVVNRRTFVALVASTGGLAGCLSSGGPDDTVTPVDSPTLSNVGYDPAAVDIVHDFREREDCTTRIERE